MKLAIVINTSWNIYNFRMGLIRAIQAKGFTVYAIAPQDDYSRLLEDQGCVFEKITMRNTGTNPLHDLALTFELYKIYKKIQPDVILHYTIKPNIYGSLAAKLLKIPVINNVSGLGTVFLNESLSSKVAMKLYKAAFRSPKKIFFQNEEDRALFMDKRLIREQISEVIPGSGIDTEKFKPVPFSPNQEFTFLLIARLLIDKGIVEYAEAIRLLRSRGVKARFQLLGALDPGHKRGITQVQLDGWIREGLISYLGTTDDVLAYIQKADCVVLPSYREGTPRTLLEAASAGKPIVTTDVPGCKNVVEHNFNGLLCRLKDPIDLANKMLEMSQTSREQLQQMGKNSRLKIEQNFAESIVITKYLTTIEQIRIK